MKARHLLSHPCDSWRPHTLPRALKTAIRPQAKPPNSAGTRPQGRPSSSPLCQNDPYFCSSTAFLATAYRTPPPGSPPPRQIVPTLRTCGLIILCVPSPAQCVATVLQLRRGTQLLKRPWSPGLGPQVPPELLGPSLHFYTNLLVKAKHGFKKKNADPP